MDIPRDKWKAKAAENIAKYMDRGGVGNGDEAELIEGARLLNTVGFALSVPFSDPTTWTQRELERAALGEFCFFKGDSRKAIDVVVNKIIEECSGDNKNFITVLPVELYFNEKLYELAIFRFKRFKESPWKFVDNIGRVYSSFTDWKENNQLPPGEMMYPLNGHLQYDSDHCVDYRYMDTPSGSTGAKVVKGVDIGSSVVGIVGAVGATFLTGGLAIPFVVAGVGCAAYGTGRSAYQLYDRGSHSESINPFTDSQSRMLWLGIGANIISFGAMGATFRLSSLALRGKTITDGFKLFVNIVNGTCLTINSIAMINSLIFMAEHIDEMSPVDILMQMASIAFWAKSIYTYKPAGTIVRDIHNQVLKNYSSNLNPNQQEQFNTLRKDFKNDAVLVRFFYESAKQGYNPNHISSILVELHNSNSEGISLNPAQGTLTFNGHTFDVSFLINVDPQSRQIIFNMLTNLNAEQTAAFNQMRNHLQNDAKLFITIAKLSHQYSITPEQATHGLIKFWVHLNNGASGLPVIKISHEGMLVLGNGHSFNIPQLVGFSSEPKIMNFISHYLLPLSSDETAGFCQIRALYGDDLKLFGWIEETTVARAGNPLKVLLLLQSEDQSNIHLFGMITELVPTGRRGNAVVSLCNEVNVSIYYLANLNKSVRNELLVMIKEIRVVNGKLVNFRMIRGCKITPEFNRRQSKNWFKQLNDTFNYKGINFDEIRPNDMNRLNGTQTQLAHLQSETVQMIRKFAFDMKPKNVSEFVSYCEFAYSSLSNEMKNCTPEQYNEQQRTNRQIGKIKLWKETQAAKSMNWLEQRAKFMRIMDVAKSSQMYAILQLQSGLSDTQLVTTIKSQINGGVLIKFGSQVSAAYHIYKRPGSDMTQFVVEANRVITDPQASVDISMTQEGNARTIDFVNATGKTGLLEAEGRVLLCTYIENAKS